MRVLLIHNDYQLLGGETRVFDMERDMLQAAGLELSVYVRSNTEISEYGPLRKLSLPLRTLWARDSQIALQRLIARSRPQVAHFINTFPLISPAAYATCQAAGVPVVQALHNYRLACPAANLVRAGRICEECSTRGLQSAVIHGCYRSSRAASATVAAMLAVHRSLGTYRHHVDVYTALTEFARSKLIETAGLPAERVVVRPNFLHPDPGPGLPAAERAPHLLFVGRLSEEKGLRTLLDAVAQLPADIPVRIVGGGPLESELRARIAAAQLRQVTLLGQIETGAVIDELKRARALIMPSECYEGLPVTLLEAFACATPVIASRCGSLAELVTNDDNGLHFPARDAQALSECIRRVWQSEALRARLGARSRACFEQRYTRAHGLESLLAVYRRATSVAAARGQGTSG